MPGYLDLKSNMTWGYIDGEDGWGGATNRSIRQLAYVGLHPTAKNSTTSTPPSSPTEGDKYIVASSPTGAWSTYNANDIAVWGRSLAAPGTLAWQRYIPFKGQGIYNEDTDEDLKFNGTTWEVKGGGSNVQSDWNETDTASDAYIRNKPPRVFRLRGAGLFSYIGIANRVHTHRIRTDNFNQAQINAMMLGDEFKAAARMTYNIGANTTTTQLSLVVTFTDGSTQTANSGAEPLTSYNTGTNLIRTSGVAVAVGTSRYPASFTVSLITTSATASDSFSVQNGTAYWGIQY